MPHNLTNTIRLNDGSESLRSVRILMVLTASKTLPILKLWMRVFIIKSDFM